MCCNPHLHGPLSAYTVDVEYSIPEFKKMYLKTYESIIVSYI